MVTSAPRNWPYPGSGWWKFDFHAHTPKSTDFGKGPNQTVLRQMSPEDWLLGYMRAGIDCVTVTDHNSGEWIETLKLALAKLETEKHPDFRTLYLFPGVEVTANGGVHVLAIFDPGCTATDVAKLLGAVKYHGVVGESAVAADCSPIEVVQAIASAKAIPILAHADSNAGAFTALSGNSLAPLLDASELIAMELGNPNAAKPALYQSRKLAWAEVLGSDSHHPSGPVGGHFPGSHFTWVKMDQPSREGLYYALLDGNGISIRRSDDTSPFTPFGTPVHFIESVQVSGARFMGRNAPEAFKFSPWFNALIGGRGTGKSTVVHLLRKVYRREADLKSPGAQDVAARTFDAFDHTPKSRDDSGGWNPDGASTDIKVVLMRDGVRYRLSWSQREAAFLVEEDAPSGWQRSSTQDITPERFPLRLFSQGQISSLAGERSQSLLGLIDLAVGAASYRVAIDEEQRRYFALRASQRELLGKLVGRSALVVQLEDVRRKLGRFETEHHAEVLKAYQRKMRQEREVKRQFELVGDVAKRLQATVADIVAEDLPAGVFDPAVPGDAAVMDSIQRLRQHVTRLVSALGDNAKSLREAAVGELQVLTQSPWEADLKSAKQRYADLVAALKSQGVNDPSEYGKLVQDRQRLEGDIATLDAVEKQQGVLATQADECLVKLKERRAALSSARDTFLKSALVGNAYVRILLEPYGRDVAALRRSFREVIEVPDDRFEDDILTLSNDEPQGGVVGTLLGNLPTDGGVAEFEKRLDTVKQQLAGTCTHAATSHFGGHFRNYLEKRYTDRPEFLDHLMAWFPDDTLQVEYSPKGDGKEFTSINRASAGQRAAAMLAFLLAHGEEPIVLDQPEDDLDNHLIYSLVVQQIRANKQRRQIIVVTHNPNIVVNGDAEMNHALDLKAGQCRVVQRGSLQNAAMRKEVCDVMEGGRDAFEKRYHRLGRS
ncbi:MAG: chromosome segregation protein SMC [Lysobacterales bacterium CG02_land_8_20_14_3_00_62_12]|nr:MAG: chromosome segregation protein SMC [Xanthomonadales bacterium CG02_land_8_20_14_3_00_62_12]